MKYNIIGVQFKNNYTTSYEGKIYTYKTTLDLKVGDYVVVDPPQGLQVVRVCDIDVAPEKAPATLKYIVCKVDLEDYQKRLEQEKKLQELENAMKKKIDSFNKFAYYESYANMDEDFKKLFDEYKELI